MKFLGWLFIIVAGGQLLVGVGTYRGELAEAEWFWDRCVKHSSWPYKSQGNCGTLQQSFDYVNQQLFETTLVTLIFIAIGFGLILLGKRRENKEEK